MHGSSIIKILANDLHLASIFVQIRSMAHCRIYTAASLSPQTSVKLSDDTAHYLRMVMRLQVGDALTIFNGMGGEYQATIEELSRQQSSCQVKSFHDVNRELTLPIHIIQCANKSEKIETVLQKGTELGAASFQITNSQRSGLKLSGPKLEKRLERWQRIIIEAAEQSERTAIPSLVWQPSLAQVQCHGMGLTLHPHQAQPWTSTRADILQAQAITYAVGPEGGWSPMDLSTLEQAGFSNMTFGSRIMRTETAAPALLAATQAILN